MKKKFLPLIILILVLIISIATVSFAHISTGNKSSVKENQTLNVDDKKTIKKFYNDSSISKQDKDEIKVLLNMPQLFNAWRETTKEDKSFEINIDSYNIIIDYLLKVIENNSTENYICIGIDGYTEEDIVLSFASKNGEILETNERVNKALSVIKTAFSDMGYKLDTIKIKDGYISFDTIDGQYSLIFILDEAKKNNNNIENKDVIVTASKVQDNWYHKKSK